MTFIETPLAGVSRGKVERIKPAPGDKFNPVCFKNRLSMAAIAPVSFSPGIQFTNYYFFVGHPAAGSLDRQA
ncbi:hypothetical protein [Nitrosomonas sp. ANs5]|uniref:hypothetical protein n=1 Tax=Nitrosomonas sp. ANs5 TaxID=3423941 RepID=UPI003D341FB2